MNRKSILLLAALVILAIVLWFTKGLEYEEKKFDFFSIDSVKVSKIEITSQSDSVTVAKVNDEWKMNIPHEVDVSKKNIERFFNKFIGISVSELPISEKVEERGMYQVDSTGTFIKVFAADGTTLLDAVYGRSARPNFGYLRKTNSDKIYLTQDIYNAVNPVMNLWRDNEILSVEQEELQKLSIISGERGFEISRADSSWMYTDEDGEFPISFSSRPLMKMLNGLKNMKTYVFYDNEYDKYKDKLESAEVQVMVELINGDSFLIRASAIENNKYVLQVNDEKDVLYEVLKSLIDRFTPSVESLKKK